MILFLPVFGVVVGVICVSVECQYYKQVMEHFICNHRVTAITNQTTSLILGSDLDLLAPTSVTTCPLGFTWMTNFFEYVATKIELIIRE